MPTILFRMAGISVHRLYSQLHKPPSWLNRSNALMSAKGASSSACHCCYPVKSMRPRPKYRITKELIFNEGIWLPMGSQTDSYYEHPGDFTFGGIQPNLTSTLASDVADQRAVPQNI